MLFTVQIMAALLSVFFIFASSIKLLGWHQQIFSIQLSFFEKYGLNRSVMFLVGVIELVGAVLLLFSGILELAGAFLICFASVGAVSFHLRFDTLKDALPALVTFSFSSLILLLRGSGLA